MTIALSKKRLVVDTGAVVGVLFCRESRRKSVNERELVIRFVAGLRVGRRSSTEYLFPARGGDNNDSWFALSRRPESERVTAELCAPKVASLSSSTLEPEAVADSSTSRSRLAGKTYSIMLFPTLASNWRRIGWSSTLNRS